MKLQSMRQAKLRKTTINSKTLKREITFSIPGKRHIYADLNGQPGTLGQQICKGGDTMGSTLSYSGNNQAEFDAICRKWYRAHVRNLKRWGHA